MEKAESIIREQRDCEVLIMRTNEYMKHMMKTIVSHKYKEGIKRELQDCIDDLMEAYIEEGMTPEEAEET